MKNSVMWYIDLHVHLLLLHHLSILLHHLPILTRHLLSSSRMFIHFISGSTTISLGTSRVYLKPILPPSSSSSALLAAVLFHYFPRARLIHFGSSSPLACCMLFLHAPLSYHTRPDRRKVPASSSYSSSLHARFLVPVVTCIR